MSELGRGLGVNAKLKGSVMQQLLFFEMNEIIFPYIQKYISKGYLPTFAKLFRDYGYVETVSEEKFSEIEPWIQWVSAHTGKALKEHGAFRLGDMVGRSHRQIWEHLEELGFRVGAISPMNAENRLKHPSFFMPDPWTETSGSGSWIFILTYKAIKQAVNDNAQRRLTLWSACCLMLGTLWYSKLTSLPTYGRLLLHVVRGRRWGKSIFLDRLLADIFIKLSAKKLPQYASLFLNAAAHIQHHFLYSSSVYEGKHKNPEWYIDSRVDPLLEAYRVYDEIILDGLKLPTAPRIMIATGLQQEPHGQVTFFYRFKDHASFFRAVGLQFQKINSLMSRDFVMEFESVDQARVAQQLLAEAAVTSDGAKLFSIDNRGRSLFIELIYSKEVTSRTSVQIGKHRIENLHQHVAFVAIRNGQHNGTGYFLDTGARSKASLPLPITHLWRKVESAVSG